MLLDCRESLDGGAEAQRAILIAEQGAVGSRFRVMERPSAGNSQWSKTSSQERPSKPLLREEQIVPIRVDDTSQGRDERDEACGPYSALAALQA